MTNPIHLHPDKQSPSMWQEYYGLHPDAAEAAAEAFREAIPSGANPNEQEIRRARMYGFFAAWEKTPPGQARDGLEDNIWAMKEGIGGGPPTPIPNDRKHVWHKIEPSVGQRREEL